MYYLDQMTGQLKLVNKWVDTYSKSFVEKNGKQVQDDVCNM